MDRSSEAFRSLPGEMASTLQSGALLGPVTIEVAQGPSRGAVMRKDNSSIWNSGVLEKVWEIRRTHLGP